MSHYMSWNVYLAGEIHSPWRETLVREAKEHGLEIVFTGPVTDHAASDSCGVRILGEEESAFWRDRKGAGVNAVRTRTLIRRADVVVVKFGEKYRQWNAAFDAGFAAALGKPLIIVHPEEFDHALKEVDETANAVARDESQVVRILRYVTKGEVDA